MELNGTLHEYLLADVFQLLAQQKATGRLEVRSGQSIGFMVLQSGMIIAAQEREDGLVSKLTSALRQFRRMPEKDLLKLISLTGNNPARFCAELINKKFISPEELSTLARTTLEDLACNLFTWSQGSYKFDSIDTVKQWAVQGVSLPADAVVMEAMRRDDEGKRLFGKLTPDIVLVPTGREHTLGGLPKNVLEMFKSPDAYLLSQIDGLTSISGLVQLSCLTSYRIKESLYRLQQAGLVTPLPEKLSQSIQAAMARGKGGGGSPVTMSSLAVSVAGSLVTAAVIAFLGFFVFQKVIMQSKVAQSAHIRTAIELSEARQKADIAALQYQLTHGRKPDSYDQLVRSGLLLPRDIAPLRNTATADSSASVRTEP